MYDVLVLEDAAMPDADASSLPTNAPFRRLDHVQLAIPAGEENRARAFYVEVLGLDEVAKPAELAARGGAWFRSGDVALHLGVDGDFRPAKKAHPAFRCSDYQGLLLRLRERHVAVVPDDIPFEGSAHCYVSDPFGNRIELIAGEADEAAAGS